MLSPNFFNTIFVFPILNILVALYKLLSLVKIPGSFGFSIIGLTVLIRLLLHPFFKQQMETAKKMQELKPHIDKLSKKHSKDPKKLQQEQLKLYQQAGINPASGCVFMIIQIPVFFALYKTLSLFLLNSNLVKTITEINHTLYLSLLKIETINPWFFGFNLALAPNKAAQWHYYLIPVVTGVLQYWQAQVSMPAAPKTDSVEERSPAERDGRGKAESVKDKKSDGGDFQQAMSMQMKYIMPLMIGWFSYTLPLGLSLYWNIFSIFSIIQYQKISPKSKALNPKQLQNPKS
ncbi:hypothetical protein COS31_03360 [Candidatus Roizmanbacteria bacterium CG02_land_8_20_14_3_00_36_15]|uniref:Membrane insertase YidC/Oxa/ALB C-terminal domain-containing protein n=2 Tax=Candidatus Roizmaniibacteriota TaxID=1752723 RepID=A0A2M8KLG1_9BACT|nr:MAG: hypothetical protein COS51_03430 [Candidatus Roizmanbacteria bacterium CG03_land_8_20_14_0_80_36_21]PIV37715.1 MAG: hypothetical protein COS31_03360 [Candidatus Roizmanbacteria bacterium CG02_land_8_20_14_3_00_36_15]PIY69672.1 MAG: hypothetical protein COY89_05365 [Candidatus Roizmanbacteria bacterium CG_4_10_14_0_8_um_filter_36_36]PJA53545.1 MAG: hypothetical protein CO166_01575 [Candidatus Roizmanbacteria bacterium CG_4_9_14_3_um_filter_36_11]PJC81823.1 MAG: hypothetical protein CO007